MPVIPKRLRKTRGGLRMVHERRERLRKDEKQSVASLLVARWA